MQHTLKPAGLITSKKTNAEKKSQLGQFFTPANTAQFMARLFHPVNPTQCTPTQCRLLDAGAGRGCLTYAFLANHPHFAEVSLSAFEIDQDLHAELNRGLRQYCGQARFTYQIIGEDFIQAAVNRIQAQPGHFTHAILNPPYKKIKSHSRHRLLLRQVGIETVNLYSAFIGLSLLLMAAGGQIVAIVPRSFCNGAYYRPFREFIFKHAAIRRIHLFGSRRQVFKQAQVLQENVIVLLERGGQPDTVTISTSTGDSFNDLCEYTQAFEQIVLPDDPHQFIHIPPPREKTPAQLSTTKHSLDDLNITVSTGPIVDFRLKQYLRKMPQSDTVPLLYPGHFNANQTEWPQPTMKKPNAIQHSSATAKWLYPNGFYCVVRRFSAKEETRRIVASVVNPAAFGQTAWLGFENHLNVFHKHKQGLPAALAYGLSVFLNATAVDVYFRRFSGHTQVNATDLRRMQYPQRHILLKLGEWAMQNGKLSQAEIDAKLSVLTQC